MPRFFQKSQEPRPSRITVPAHGHPLVRFVFSEMQRQGVTYMRLADKSGISRETITAWRVRNVPDLSSLEAVLGMLGFRIADMLEKLPETAPAAAPLPSLMGHNGGPSLDSHTAARGMQ